MAVNFAAYLFQGKHAAEDALREVESAQAEGLVWVEDVAVVKRGKLGRLKVYSTWAQDDSTVSGSASWGGLTDARIGALAGPGEAFAGPVAGGAIGGAFGAAADISVSDPTLEALARSMEKDTSALVLIGETAPFVDVLGHL
jgi:uncharacterized membrane protein